MPKRTPTAMKELAGNPGHRPLPKDEPKPTVEVPEPPDFLERHAIEEWYRIAPILKQLNIVTLLDRTALTMYCEAYGRWVDALYQVRLTGGNLIVTKQGNIIQNPALGVANRSFDHLRDILREFGLTPTTRAKVTTAKSGESGETDVWAKLLN